MSAFAKTKLKAAREALSKKDYEKARDAALSVLEYEPDNYNGNVFLGVAFFNLKEYEKCEQTYRKAIELNPDHLLGWQGISKLYEETKNWSEMLKVLDKVAHLHASGNDATKCAEAVQKIIDIRREFGTSLELADALALLLPDSPFYSILSSLPPPDYTNPTSSTTFYAQSAIHNSLPILEELVAIHEQYEGTTIKNEIAKRRQRLGAPPLAQLQNEVALEILTVSKLPQFYNEVINHPVTSNELRRETEGKLLYMKQQHLFSLPVGGKSKGEKARLADEVDEIIKGIVLLKIPNELAWTLFIESKDATHIEDYDFDILRHFIQLFPSATLTEFIQSYFEYMAIPLHDEEDDESHPRVAGDDEVDHIDVMMEAFTSLSDSILAHRIVAELYEQEADYESAIKISESGLELARRTGQNWGRTMTQTKKAFDVILATSLVHHFPPKHHARALGIVDSVLAEDPDNLPSLMGRGVVLQYAKKWQEASAIFKKVTELDPEGVDHGLRAKEERAWCEAMSDHLYEAADELREVIAVLDELEGRDEDKARAWWRLGRCHWDMGSEHREEAYKYFVTALKRYPTFAPAFTSLGIYYSEFLTPPDPNRASKCFQKAFELDPREADAARRLAQGFAEEGEWDLVEVVARRTIEGEGGLEDGPDVRASRRYLPINAWAWKAVGAVEMARRHYDAAIEAFQIALRTDVDDQVSWLRLGEAYSKAGRYAAAVKALEHARELDPTDWIAEYFIGDVRRQMGVYEEAVQAFESILEKLPEELGVLQSLGQTYLELGQLELTTGFSTRAETSFVSAIRVMLRFVAASPGFRRVAWKTVADSLLRLSSFSIFSGEEDVREAVSSILPLVSEQTGQSVAATLIFPLSLDETTNLSLSIAQVAIAAYDYRLSLGGIDDTAKGTAHYDLGISLATFARRTLDSVKREQSEQEAIVQFKQALGLEPTNDTFWVALGNATFSSQPKIAQHSYIRALEIDNKNAATWTSLGMFYLHHEDVEVANEAFYKSQILDPDYALAWVGQGLVATVNKHDKEASALFEHASDLTASVPEADFEFATRLFRKVNASTKSRLASSEALLPAFFVLDRYCKQRPQDASALHLFGLVCERVGHVELGVKTIARAIAVLEAAYEETEDSVIERQYATAHANIARLKLSTGDYDGSLESYSTAIGLLPDPELEADEIDTETRRLLVQCQFGSGLARFKMGELPEALQLFESALATAGEDSVLRGHVVVLLAQTLWAIGTDEAKESAKAQLLQSIEYDPENLMAINTLAGMGILTVDDGLVDAALSELLSLPVDDRHARDPEREITYLLVQHNLGQEDAKQALSIAQKAVFAEPERTDVRRELAELTLQSGESAAALAILGGATQIPGELAQLRDSLALHAVALCLEDQGEEARRLGQRSVMLSPWDRRGWEALAYVRSRSAAT